MAPDVIDTPTYLNIQVELKERMLDWYMASCDVVPWEFDQRW